MKIMKMMVLVLVCWCWFVPTPNNAGGKYSSNQPLDKVGYYLYKTNFVCKIWEKNGRRRVIGNYPSWEGAALAYDREAIKANKSCNFACQDLTSTASHALLELSEGEVAGLVSFYCLAVIR